MVLQKDYTYVYKEKRILLSSPSRIHFCNSYEITYRRYAYRLNPPKPLHAICKDILTYVEWDRDRNFMRHL